MKTPGQKPVSQGSKAPADEKKAKQDRLAKALRSNLLRRKAAAQADSKDG